MTPPPLFNIFAAFKTVFNNHLLNSHYLLSRRETMFKTNEYFDGKVKSIAFQTGTSEATVGVMAPGDYVFNTSEKEQMSVVSGAMKIQLTGSDETKTYHAGESFTVDANSAFNVSVDVETAYLCLYG